MWRDGLLTEEDIDSKDLQGAQDEIDRELEAEAEGDYLNDHPGPDCNCDHCSSVTQQIKVMLN